MHRTHQVHWGSQVYPQRVPKHSALNAALVLAIGVLAILVAPRVSEKIAGLGDWRAFLAPTASIQSSSNLIDPRATDPTHVWIDQLSPNYDPALRESAKANLLAATDAQVIPALIDALTDPEPSVRASTAEILASKHADSALDALTFTTYDPDSSVRLAAVRALDDLALPLALTRLEQLQVMETDSPVRDAASRAQEKIYARLAADLGHRSDYVRAVGIAPANGRVYAATWDGVYAPAGLGWQMKSRLPDIPTTLTVSPENADVIYVGTAALGILKSADAGRTWMQMAEGLPPAERTTVTALAISPNNPRVIFATLAAWFDTPEMNELPNGLYVSQDAGETWTRLAQWQADYVTARLVIDPLAPNFLYGRTRFGTWRVPLLGLNCDSC